MGRGVSNVNFFAYAVILLVSTAISYYAAQAAQRAYSRSIDPGELDTPTTNEGTPIPILFGTRLITAPKMVFVGTVTTKAIKS